MKKRIIALSALLTLCLSLACAPARAEARNGNLPRVLDEADIFTDSEEAKIEARLTELRQELDRDFVIYTDVTDHGQGKKLRAADFYDSNGYGCGPEREGVCLFIDMDPNDRGWWVCCTGSATMGLYTEEAANALDDALYAYMAGGQYAAGVLDWAENFAGMYRKGIPFAPDWYPNAGEEAVFHHDPEAPRLVDELGYLTFAQAAELSERAAKISERYGVDVAIHTMKAIPGTYSRDVADTYYASMGYGLGDGFDGILLTVFKEEGYYPYPRIVAFGSAAERLTEVNNERLRSACAESLEAGEHYAALSGWLDRTDHMLRTGRVPEGLLHWILVVLGGGALGALFGGISLLRARAKMKKPAVKRDADDYIEGSSSIRSAGRYYLYTTTSRRYDPPQEKSSRSSGGGGRSSYSGSYSGSSGSSHSGSGRSF